MNEAIYLSIHMSVVLILTGVILSLGIWGIRCFRIGLKPAHRNVKYSYLTITGAIWLAIATLLIN